MESRLSRRQFIGASAGLAAAASLGGASVTLGGAGSGGGRTIPPGLLGLQQFSVRDATARRGIATSTRLGLQPAMGFLGGPDYPADPTDLGPLVPLPGGFAEVFEFLALGRHEGLRVLPVDAARRRAGAPADRGGDPAVPRRRGAEGGRNAPVRPRQPRSRDRRPHGERRDAVRVPEHARDGAHGVLRQSVAAPEQLPEPGEPDHEPAERLGVAGGLREPADRGPHVRVPQPGGAREPHRRDPGVARGAVLLPPGAGQLPLLQRPGAPRARHGAPDQVGDGQHRSGACSSGRSTSCTTSRGASAS